MSRAALGQRGEQIAARYLVERGWDIVARNFRTREGEVDLIARRADVLAFVEVKTRRSALFGSPAEAVTERKRTRIRTLARLFLQGSGVHAPTIRFDVMEVTPDKDGMKVSHIEGAF